MNQMQLEGMSVLADGRYFSMVEATSRMEVILPDGRSEQIQLRSSSPTEFAVSPPMVEADGTTVLEVEIFKFEVTGESQVLWPGQTVTMSGGRMIGHEALPIFGTVRIPAGQSLSDGAHSEQQVYVQVDTPLGRLHNIEPVRMSAVIDAIPPRHVFHSVEGRTRLIGDHGQVMDLVACTSTITSPPSKPTPTGV